MAGSVWCLAFGVCMCMYMMMAERWRAARTDLEEILNLLNLFMTFRKIVQSVSNTKNKTGSSSFALGYSAKTMIVKTCHSIFSSDHPLGFIFFTAHSLKLQVTAHGKQRCSIIISSNFVVSLCYNRYFN